MERLGRDSWGGLQLLQEEGFQVNRTGSPVLPPFSRSSQFKLVSGAISSPEQNPDSVPRTCERVITSVSLGETDLLLAGRSLMWKQRELRACMCINTDSSRIKSGGRSFPDQHFPWSSFLLWVKE